MENTESEGQTEDKGKAEEEGLMQEGHGGSVAEDGRG